jgi:hypothetical protein
MFIESESGLAVKREAGAFPRYPYLLSFLESAGLDLAVSDLCECIYTDPVRRGARFARDLVSELKTSYDRELVPAGPPQTLSESLRTCLLRPGRSHVKFESAGT